MHSSLTFACNFYITERHNRVAVVVRATGDSSESSTSLSIVDSVKNAVSSPPSLFPFGNRTYHYDGEV